MAVTLFFKNFKPFGEKLQVVPQKPIILVYGPNSAGKSSLIDASVYHHHLKLAYDDEYGDPNYLNISNPYFAGDKLNLGGFENMVHQKNTTKEIYFETIYDIHSRDDFGRFLPDFSIANDLFRIREYIVSGIELFSCRFVVHSTSKFSSNS